MKQEASSIPWDPDNTVFPTRKELPPLPGAPAEAAWVWGDDDYLGRLNLLTPRRVAAAAKEIQSGEIVPVNLPLNVPSTPSFGREAFKHEIKTLAENIAYDDLYHLNTQSGTQWDGFRHCAHIPSGSFYNGTKGSDITGPTANPDKCSIHHWAAHGIAGRGLLLDYRAYAQSQNIEYDPYSSHSISWAQLFACGTHQGLDIRPAAQGGAIQPGDMLFIRTGWKEAYDSKTDAERHAAVQLQDDDRAVGRRYAGVAQEEAMLDWLHDCYFACVAGDAPAFETWPTKETYHLHEYILALWGMPLGEMLDLEKLASKCREKQRWFFFFTSAPANCYELYMLVGGVSSHVNGTAIF